MDGRSLDILEENIDKMKQLFPEVFTEEKIDIEKLKEVLGEYSEDENERYDFTWNGKKDAIRISQTPTTGTLRPNKENSKNWDDTENLYIEGDNLEVLKLLQKSYHSKIKMIYIDPPYNTGKDFVYRDNYKDNMKNYLEFTGQVDSEGKKTSTNSDSSGRYHTNWLNMMYPRLRLARNLLTDDGVIFISIDENEVHNLRKICDEIFGEDNFVGQITWQTATDNNPSQISIEHEYIVCYSKNIVCQNKWLIKSEKAKYIIKKYNELKDEYDNNLELVQKELKKWINDLTKSKKIDLSGVSHYSYVDDKGVYYPGNSANTKPGGYNFDVNHPITRQICKRPTNGYRWPKQTLDEADEIGNVDWGKDETTIPKIKKRIETATELLKSYYYEDSRKSTSYFNNLMNGKVFDNPKSLELMERLLRFTSKKNSIILDFFSGSSTTAHSVMDLNAEDGGNRKFIMVQLPEETDEKSEAFKAGYKTISEIGRERIRRAGEKIKQDNKDIEGIKDLDIGFKSFKLDSSNIKEWNPEYDDKEFDFESLVNNFVDGRGEDDILYEIILKYGIDLTTPIEEHLVDDKTIYDIGFGSLYICLDNNIDERVIQKISSLNKESGTERARVVFKDNGFKNDETKLNAKLTLENNGIAEVLSI